MGAAVVRGRVSTDAAKPTGRIALRFEALAVLGEEDELLGAVADVETWGERGEGERGEREEKGGEGGIVKGRRVEGDGGGDEETWWGWKYAVVHGVSSQNFTTSE